MKKATTKLELLEFLKDIRAVEIKARHGYVEDINTFKNFQILESLKEIKLDEDRHISLLDGLIKKLEK